MKYIWFCIELIKYYYSDWKYGKSNAWHSSNIKIIGRAIGKLLLILSTWKPSGSLVLDISIHSHKEPKHHFKRLPFGSDAVPESDDNEDTAKTHDPLHGWVNGEKVFLTPQNFIQALLKGTKIEVESSQKLREVTAVTGLLLRRQTRHGWHPLMLKQLLSILPRLQEIYYEPWRELCQSEQQFSDEGKSP